MIHYLSNKPQNIVDILLVTGDAYIDHPSFGIAIISRVLEQKGYSICIISQPEYYDDNYLDRLPEVRLFIGITAGNLDSIVANYTSNRTIRKKDSYSIDDNPFFENGKRKRPDRATIFYTAYFKKRYKNIPIVLGGIEASLRRVAHYDYIQQKIRKSVLTDSKADILVYSMGERAILEIAERIQNNKALSNISGTAIRGKYSDTHSFIELPSYNEIISDRSKLITATNIIEDNMVYDKSDILIQNQDTEYITIFPPQKPLTQNELDNIYSLPFRKNYPEYCEIISAWNMIKSSVTSHRGCFGRCSFCAITAHQGPTIVSRSEKSIKIEIEKLTTLPFYKKTVTDIGGPTANMYGLDCKIGWCKSPQCLFPTLCKNLIINEDYLTLLKSVKKIEGVKNLFVSSGLRHDLALLKKNETEWIITNSTSGHLKIAPEHIDENILKLMKKPNNDIFIDFINFFNNIKKKNNLNFYILPYLILSFPGSNRESIKNLGSFLNKHKIRVYQYQDFTPTPSTLATAMYYSEKNLDGKEIPIPRISSKNNVEREILEQILKPISMVKKSNNNH